MCRFPPENASKSWCRNVAEWRAFKDNVVGYLTLYDNYVVKIRNCGNAVWESRRGVIGDKDLNLFRYTLHTIRMEKIQALEWLLEQLIYECHFRDILSTFFFSLLIFFFRDKLYNACSWTKKQINQRTCPSAQVGVNWAPMLSFKTIHPSMLAFDENSNLKITPTTTNNTHAGCAKSQKSQV